VLRRIEIEITEPPAAGSKLKSSDGQSDAGEIASAAFSPALGKVAALAYVRTQFAEPGTELRLGGVRVLVI
jgi:glycine cleavage system aminomethyltransferase T